MLELREINKRFAGTTVLRDISLTVAEGSTTVLIGPSGCGKSTLVRIVNGLILADSGTVGFMGQEVDRSTAPALRRRMGYVIQEGGLFPHLTAHGNVVLMARHLGWPSERISRRVDELVELTRFPGDGLKRYPAQLSGGQRQRVALMRALMLDPELLLLDEPLGALDPLIRYELQMDLRNVFQSLQKTVVMVTHDLAEAAHFADQVVLLRDGGIEQQGGMRTLLEAPVTPFVERFVNAQRSLLSGIG